MRAIVTAPIAKEALAAAGVRYPGHTEILADQSGAGEVAMMLANNGLRVLLVSVHLSLADAIRAVTPEAELGAIRLADRASRRLGVARPRVAVAGLNPHAGEAGMFGREEIEIITPAIQQARAEGIDASGPWPGDTAFMRVGAGAFDIVVAQYHDQGLIPVKYLGLDQGVNVTVGLPFVRTSPDHGTAFEIAGTGNADHASLRTAFRQALMMTAPDGRAAPGRDHAAWKGVPRICRRILGSDQVFEASRSVDDALDHNSVLIGCEQNEVAAVNGLTQTFGEIVPAPICLRSFGEPRANHQQFVDERDGVCRVSGRNEVSDGLEVINGARPKPVPTHRRFPATLFT